MAPQAHSRCRCRQLITACSASLNRDLASGSRHCTPAVTRTQWLAAQNPAIRWLLPVPCGSGPQASPALGGSSGKGGHALQPDGKFLKGQEARLDASSVGTLRSSAPHCLKRRPAPQRGPSFLRARPQLMSCGGSFQQSCSVIKGVSFEVTETRVPDRHRPFPECVRGRDSGLRVVRALSARQEEGPSMPHGGVSHQDLAILSPLLPPHLLAAGTSCSLSLLP